jgi:hypothetical protein
MATFNLTEAFSVEPVIVPEEERNETTTPDPEEE